MSINTAIWGDVSEWGKTGQITAYTDDKDCIYMTSDYIDDIQTLSIGTPIDKTISFSGLGTESPYSHLKWFDVNELNAATAGDKIYTPTKQDSRNVTNFSLSKLNDYGNTSYSQNAQFLVDGDETSRNTDPTKFRWSPSPATGQYSNIAPVTRFNYKNFLCCIYVRAGTSITGTYTTFDLDTYMSTGHTTHPVIGSVFFMPYINSIDGINQRVTAWDVTGAPTYMHVAIIDNFNGLSSSPYSYGYFNCNGRWFMLLGGIVQNTSSIANGYNSIDCQTYTADTRKSYQGIVGGNEWYVYINRKGADWVEGVVAREYSDTFYDECMSAMACFGYFFVKSETVAKDPDTKLTDDDVYCGVLDESLIGHGDYTHGVLNVRNPQWDWETSDDSNYDPSKDVPIDPNTYGTSSSFNAVTVADGTLKRYALNVTDMAALGLALWDIIDTTDPDALIQNQTLTNFLTNNPLDCIVSIKKFALPDMGQSGTTNIRLGKVTVPNTSAKQFLSSTTTLSCGSKYIYPIFFDWRDYLCEYTLILPFCGTVSLPPEVVTGKWIEVKYSIDYTTGTCTAWVISQLDDGGEVVIDSASGNCAIDIPVSGVQTADLTAQIYNANESLKGMKFNNLIDGVKGGMSFVGSIASGNKVAAISSGLNVGQDIVNSIHGQSVAEWNINHTQLPLKMIGASSGCNSFTHELTPRLIIYYPDIPTFNQEEYAHTVGYACCETDKIGNRSGYAEINNVNLTGFSATSTEKEMIQNLLSGGVYL